MSECKPSVTSAVLVHTSTTKDSSSDKSLSLWTGQLMLCLAVHMWEKDNVLVDQANVEDTAIGQWKKMTGHEQS